MEEGHGHGNVSGDADLVAPREGVVFVLGEGAQVAAVHPLGDDVKIAVSPHHAHEVDHEWVPQASF